MLTVGTSYREISSSSVCAAKPCGARHSTLSVLEDRDQSAPSVDERPYLRVTKARETKVGEKIMPLIQLLEVLIVVGVLLWLVNRFIPMQSTIKSILNGVVVIAVVLWLLNVFGLFHNISNIHVGKG
jgi:hypothetical protein